MLERTNTITLALSQQLTKLIEKAAAEEAGSTEQEDGAQTASQKVRGFIELFESNVSGLAAIDLRPNKSEVINGLEADETNRSPFLTTVILDLKELNQFLLSHGGNPVKKQKQLLNGKTQEMTMLEKALFHHHFAIFENMLKTASEENLLTKELLNKLLLDIVTHNKERNEIKHHQSNLIKLVLDYKADPNTENKDKQAVIMLAAKDRLSTQIIQTLIDAGAGTNVVDENKRPLIDIVVTNEYPIETIRAVLNKSATYHPGLLTKTLESITPNNKIQKIELAKELLELKIDKAELDDCLIDTEQRENKNEFEDLAILIRQKGGTFSRTQVNEKMLDLVKNSKPENSKQDILKLRKLLRLGADVNYRDKDGRNVLFFAVFNDLYDIAEELSQSSFDKSVSKSGFCFLSYSTYPNRKSLTRTHNYSHKFESLCVIALRSSRYKMLEIVIRCGAGISNYLLNFYAEAIKDVPGLEKKDELKKLAELLSTQITLHNLVNKMNKNIKKEHTEEDEALILNPITEFNLDSTTNKKPDEKLKSLFEQDHANLRKETYIQVATFIADENNLKQLSPTMLGKLLRWFCIFESEEAKEEKLRPFTKTKGLIEQLKKHNLYPTALNNDIHEMPLYLTLQYRIPEMVGEFMNIMPQTQWHILKKEENKSAYDHLKLPKEIKKLMLKKREYSDFLDYHFYITRGAKKGQEEKYAIRKKFFDSLMSKFKTYQDTHEWFYAWKQEATQAIKETSGTLTRKSLAIHGEILKGILKTANESKNPSQKLKEMYDQYYQFQQASEYKLEQSPDEAPLMLSSETQLR